jgi:hypothetical protein
MDGFNSDMIASHSLGDFSPLVAIGAFYLIYYF